jgi:hypothetical protein
MAETRACEQCGAVFEPRREHARFCSARCRVAWNRRNSGDREFQESALSWAIVAMGDTTQRLDRVRAIDRPQAFTVIIEAVWWVTIVDATLVRYHPDAYDRAMADQDQAERQPTEQTFTGLRFVRNWIGYHADPSDFIQPQAMSPDGSRDAPVTDWTWQLVPAPEPGALAPRGQAWEATRHSAYQAQLAGHTIGETFERAATFLQVAAKYSQLTE